MLQQHGIGYGLAMDSTKRPAKSPSDLEEKHKELNIEAAKNLASAYRTRLIEARERDLVIAAKELYRYVNGELKTESPKYYDAFLDAIDGRSDGAQQSYVLNCLKQSSADLRKAAIFIIVCLGDTQPGNMNRYINYILMMLTNGCVEEDIIKMSCRAVAHLLKQSKGYSADTLERCIEHANEWMTFGQVNEPVKSKGEINVEENRRLAAAHMFRELVISAPGPFLVRAPDFYRVIFVGLRDRNPIVRIASVDTLHAVLTATSQREAKQKCEWYQDVFNDAFATQTGNAPADELSRYHSVALVLNELLRISDCAFEKVRLESSQATPPPVSVEDGIHWVINTKFTETIESATARQMVRANFQKIMDCVRKIILTLNTKPKGTAASYLNTVLMQLLPRICTFPECDAKFHQLAFDTAFAILQKSAVAAPAIGMMMLSNPENHKKHVGKVMQFIGAQMKKSPHQANEEVLENYFTFLFLVVDAYNQVITDQIKAILPILLDLPLSRGLANVLKMIMMRIPKLRLNVQDGVMATVYLNLTGTQVPSKSEPAARPPAPRAILQKANSDARELSKLVLSIETLGDFYFSRGALQRIMQYVADYYLVADDTCIRMVAVKCCCDMIIPFVSVYKKITSDKRQHFLSTIQGVLRALVSVIVNDPHVDVRMKVIKCFGSVPREFLVHLAQPEMLEVQFMALHDERLEMQQECVTLLGRLAELNPALVLPRMRLMLLETLSQMTHSGQSRLEQHSAKMIKQLAEQSPKFIRPYIGSLLLALIPKLRLELRHSDVTTEVLNAISELSVIGGAEIVRNLNPIFEKLIYMINDSSNIAKRSAALRAIGQICRSTAYVVDPYKDYPTLLDDLFKIMKTVINPEMRKVTIKTLGILGAIDPYTHKVFSGSVQSSTAISTALSLPMTPKNAKDPRMDIINWFNYEKCTLEEFYPAISIANLMVMMQDEDTQCYAEIAQTVVTIFRSLGDAASQYVDQVVPRLIEVCRRCDAQNTRASLKVFFIRQLSLFVSIIKKHANPFMPQIFAIIADAWREDMSVKMCILSVLEEMGTALGADFSSHTGELIPYLLHVLQTDKTKDRTLSIQVLEVMRPLCQSLLSHLHLVLPPVLIILDDNSLRMSIRQAALDTILHMAQNVDVTAYAPRMMQSWHHNIAVQELREKLLLLLIELIKQLGKHFDVFRRSVEIKLRDNGLDKSEHYDLYRKLAQRAQMSRDVITSSLFNGNGTQNGYAVKGNMAASAVLGNIGLHERLMNGSMESAHSNVEMKQDYDYGLDDTDRAPTQARSTKEKVEITIAKQRVNVDGLQTAWRFETITNTKEEWNIWLMKMRTAFLKYSSSPSLRASAGLGEAHQHLGRDLFPAAFMSVWTELSESAQDDLTHYLSTALKTGYPDVIQAVLNLAEFMDHSEKGPLPITYETLGGSAEDVKAYAKACRYKELCIVRKWEKTGDCKLEIDECQSLINFANKLNVQEEAAGVVRYAERNRMNIKTRGRWYEKLNEWEKALESYQNDHEQNDETTMHEMRCLEALAQWKSLNEKAETLNLKEGNHPPSFVSKAAVIAARGAWAVGNWEKMYEYATCLSENTQEGAMLRAIVHVHHEDFPKAILMISKARDMFDSDVTAVATESYERAYTPMISVQQMAELEEAIEYKQRPERRPRIALLWSRRLQGCRRNVEQWQRLIMLRGLVLSKQEMSPLRVKFSSLCRKQGKNSMSRAVLREELDLPPDADLLEARVNAEKPLLVLALAKQLYQDEEKMAALKTLEGLAKHMDRNYRNPGDRQKVQQQSREHARICAKVFMKLGEWTDAKANRQRTTGELSFIQQQVTPPTNTRGGHAVMRTPEQIAMNKTISYFEAATQFDERWHKAWHKLGSTYFYATMKEAPKKSNGRVSYGGLSNMSPLGLPPPYGNTPQTTSATTALHLDCPIPPPLGSLAGLSNLAGSTNVSGQSSPLFISPVISNQAFVDNAVHAINCFSKAILYAPGSRLEDTLRLLQLWFDFGDHDRVYKALLDNISDLPINTWFEVVPQLMARLDSSDKEKPVQLVIKVLAEIAKHKPQSVIYALTVGSRSHDENRKKNASLIIAKMGEYHPELVEECKIVTHELVRCAILWHELWHDALDDASKHYYQKTMQENNVQTVFHALKEMIRQMDHGPPQTMKEHSFHQTYNTELTDAENYLTAFERCGNVKDMNQAWEIYCGVFKKLRDQIGQLNSLDLMYVSPALVNCKNLSLAVPGTYDPSAPVVSISAFQNKMTVMPSKQRPRRMTIRGSNGFDYQFLLKGREDPRQDERVMQLFGLVNTLLANNSETCRRNLAIQRYSIIALSKDSGLIGWVPNCDTIHALVKEFREKKAKIPLALEHKTLQKISLDTEHLTLMQKLQLFDNALGATKGDDIRQIIWLKSPSSEVWFDRRTNYTRSVACMSMVGYILGLGDRHPSNLMLDRLTGKIVHIDFGDCFEVAMMREKFPERVPFRLTRMLIQAMEVTGLEGVYRYTAERVLKVLRTNQEPLLAVLEAFVYDPIINWRLVEGPKKDPKLRKEQIRVNTGILPSATTTQETIDTIKKKLAGTEFVTTTRFMENPEPIPVSEQLEQLIDMATSNINLCQSYTGWCPFW